MNADVSINKATQAVEVNFPPQTLSLLNNVAKQGETDLNLSDKPIKGGVGTSTNEILGKVTAQLNKLAASTERVVAAQSKITLGQGAKFKFGGGGAVRKVQTLNIGGPVRRFQSGGDVTAGLQY